MQEGSDLMVEEQIVPTALAERNLMLDTNELYDDVMLLDIGAGNTEIGVFERNLELLKSFLISTLELKLDVDSTKIEISNNELLKENVKEYQKRVDILVILNDTIFIDFEINRSSFEKVKLRNSLYCDKLYSVLLEMGDKTTKLKDIYLYQLNLNTMDKSITYGEDKIVSFSLVTKNIFIKNKFMILKYLEFYRELYYTNVNNLSESEIWLASLTSKNFTELNEILTHILDAKDRNKLISEAIRMSKINFSLANWETDKINDLMRESSKDRSRGRFSTRG